MKILCETNGSFQLVDFGNGGDVIKADRPSVVSGSPFVSARAALGQLKVLGNVNDEATDAEFEEYFKASDSSELAVASFLEAYSTEVTKKVSKRKGKAEVETEAETDDAGASE